MSQRDAYLQFATGYLWATVQQLRSSPNLPKHDDQLLAETIQFISPILAKLHLADEIQPNRFLLFTDQQLISLQSALFSNEKTWRYLIMTELARREQLPVPSKEFSSIPVE